MPLVIRRMLLEDVAQVYEIDKLSFSLPWTERSFRFEVAENSAARTWVAETVNEQGENIIVGMLVLWMILDEAHIGTIATHPDYRRLHIGEKILAHSLLDASQLGANVSMLEARRGNTPALSMYMRFGYQVDGVRPRYYQDNGEDAILMSLPRLLDADRQALLRSILQG